MNATVVDLRYRTRDILNALERRETVNILYHGKLKGVLVPSAQSKTASLEDHPFFGSAPSTGRSATAVMRELRAGRYRAL